MNIFIRPPLSQNPGSAPGHGDEKLKDDNEVKECQPDTREEPNRSSDEDDHKVSPLTEQSTTCKPARFNITLICTSANSSTVESARTLTVREFPESVAELKKAIQQEFHVPMYDQKLSFGCSLMEDSEKLDFYRIKDGDQFTVEYTATAEVESVFHLLLNLRDILNFLKGVQSQLRSNTISSDLSKNISDVLCVSELNRNMQHLFTRGDTRANTKFFLNNEGLHVTTELHSLLLKQTWNEICHIDLQHLEKIVLRLLLMICAGIPPKQTHEVVSSLDNVVRSFLRVSVPPTDFITVPNNPKLPATSRSEQLQVLVDVIHTALGCLCK